MPDAVDDFKTFQPNLESPIGHIEAVTPSDTVDLVKVPRVVVCAVAGDIAVLMPDGSTGVIPSCQAGIWYSMRPRRILLTGTSASGMVALS